MRKLSPSMSATIRGAPRSGTRSNIALSATIMQNWCRPSACQQNACRLTHRCHNNQNRVARRGTFDERTFEKGIKISNAEMQALDICGDKFHPE